MVRYSPQIDTRIDRRPGRAQSPAIPRASFTPGPWFAADGGVVWHEAIVGVSHPECCGDFMPSGECCGLSVQGYHEELAQEQIASCSPNDADLIAAAPELYAALERLVRRCDTTTLEDGSSIDTLTAHAALAKARGEVLFAEDAEQ